MDILIDKSTCTTVTKADATALQLANVSEVEHLIIKEYSYQAISGLDLNINPTDYFILSSDDDHINTSCNLTLVESPSIR